MYGHKRAKLTNNWSKKHHITGIKKPNRPARPTVIVHTSCDLMGGVILTQPSRSHSVLPTHTQPSDS